MMIAVFFIVSACRDILLEYGKHVMNVGIMVLELLSEALGLKPNHLKEMGCAEGLAFLGHYYPACPEPERTLGTTNHSDNDFITVLLQDHIGGLQALYEHTWIDIPPVPGALVVNIGDYLQASFHFFPFSQSCIYVIIINHYSLPPTCLAQFLNLKKVKKSTYTQEMK